MSRIFCFLFASIILTGCAASVSPQKLLDTKRDECLTVSEAVSYKDERGMFNVVWEEGVVPGRYRAEKEDEKGIYYRGPERAVWRGGLPGTYRVMPGGIWLPKDTKKAPRLYTYIEDEIYTSNNVNTAGQGVNVGRPEVGGVVVEALVKLEVGRIVLLPEIMDEKFMRAISSAEPCIDSLK